MAEYAILTEKLGRRYGSTIGLDDASLLVRTGEAFALVGPNGAGKTTLIMLLVGILRPSSGKAIILGSDTTREYEKVGRSIGTVLDHHGLYESLSAMENMRLFAGLLLDSAQLGEHRIKEMLTLTDLWDRRNDRVVVFSKGMKQRLAIARALLNNPRLLIMDEPLSGLDPESHRKVIDLIRDLNRNKGVTVFLTSHSLHDVEELCSRVAVLSKGRIVACDMIDKLRAGRPVSLVEFKLSAGQSRNAVNEILEHIRGMVSYSWLSDERLQVEIGKGIHSCDVLRQMVLDRIEVREVREIGNTLEDIYLTIMKDEDEKR